MRKLEKNRKFFTLNRATKLLGVLFMLLFVSCESDDNDVVKDPGNYADGVFVLNEGKWEASNASVSFIPAAADTIMGDLFKEANGENAVLGDVLQDMVSVDTLSFLVLNGSHSVMVVNNKNFEYVDEITGGIDNPRYALVHDDLVYISQWGNDGEVVVLDPVDFSIVNTIAVGTGPDGMQVVDNEIWVANSGGYGFDNTISVINPGEGSVKETIEVGDCPKDFAVDANGNVWVVCSGYTNWDTGESTSPFINVISGGNSYEVLQSLEIDAQTYGQPGKIAVAADGQSIYFGGGYGISGIWEMSVDATELPVEAFIDVTPSGLDVNPANGDIYCGVAPSFEEPGYVSVYDTNGSEIVKYEENIGIGPNKFVFVNR